MHRRPPRSPLLPYTTLFRPLPSRLGRFVSGRGGEPPCLCCAACVMLQIGSISPQLPINDSCRDRKSTRLNSSHANISYAVFCLKTNRVPYPRCPALYRIISC